MNLLSIFKFDYDEQYPKTRKEPLKLYQYFVFNYIPYIIPHLRCSLRRWKLVGVNMFTYVYKRLTYIHLAIT